MKHFGSIVGKSAAYGVALLAASIVSSLQAQTQQGSAMAFDIKGSADYSVGGGTWNPLRGGTELKAGSAVVVHVDSSGKTTTFVVNGGQSFDPTVPGVRPGTQPELDSVAPPRPPVAGVPVVLYEPSRIPYVSEFSPKDTARGD